jgi:hypothetical protein
LAVGSFISGRYSGSYTPPGGGAGDLGLMQRGYEIQITFAKQLINDTDGYAECVVDGVYRGGNCFLQGTSREYKSGVLAAALPYGTLAATGANSFGPGVIGRLDSAVAGSLVLSATAATPAAASPATLTGAFTILAPNFDVRMFMGPEARMVPMRFQFMLYIDAGNANLPTWFKTT